MEFLEGNEETFGSLFANVLHIIFLQPCKCLVYSLHNNVIGTKHIKIMTRDLLWLSTALIVMKMFFYILFEVCFLQ